MERGEVRERRGGMRKRSKMGECGYVVLVLFTNEASMFH